MGNTRDLCKKIRDTKGILFFLCAGKSNSLLCKDGRKKDRNDMNITEAEDIKKRWQEDTEELYKKELHDPDNYNGVITHLEPDILHVKSSGP